MILVSTYTIALALLAAISWEDLRGNRAYRGSLKA